MKRIIYTAILGMFVLGGCTTSFITSSWKPDNSTNKLYKKVLVLGLIGDPDRSLRENMEEHLAGDLREMGYLAFTSKDIYGPAAFQWLKEEEAINLLRDRGFDAVMTIVLLNKTKEKYYFPGRINYSPYGVQHVRFWGYYSAMQDRIYSPGYYTEDTRFFWETNLFDMSDAKLTYSAQSQSFDPVSGKKLAHEYGLMIMQDLVKKQVLARQVAPIAKPF